VSQLSFNASYRDISPGIRPACYLSTAARFAVERSGTPGGRGSGKEPNRLCRSPLRKRQKLAFLLLKTAWHVDC